MLEAISLDQKTMILRSDIETDFSEIINFVIKKDKNRDIESFLKFAEKNEVTNRLIQKRFSVEIIKENIEYMCKICTIQNFNVPAPFGASFFMC